MFLLRKFIILTLTLFALPVMAQGDDDANKSVLLRTIAVQGEAEMEVTPDEARFRVNIADRNQNADEAMANVAKAQDAVLAVLKEFGIEGNDLQSSSIRMDFIYEEGGLFGKPSMNIASADIDVHARDLTKLAELLPALIEAGATEFGGLYFDYSKRDDAKNEAMVMAVGDALETAKKLADASGMQVGDPIQIEFGRVNFGAPEMRAMSDGMMFEAVADAPPPSPKISIAPGQITISSDVRIQYEMMPK